MTILNQLKKIHADNFGRKTLHCFHITKILDMLQNKQTIWCECPVVLCCLDSTHIRELEERHNKQKIIHLLVQKRKSLAFAVNRQGKHFKPMPVAPCHKLRNHIIFNHA